MNLESLPQVPILSKEGHLSSEWQNFFSINNQNLILFFGNVGHLVPRRGTADITALSTQQNLGRSLHNFETKNEMTNADGVYKNNTQNTIVASIATLPTAEANRVEFYGDANHLLAVNVNGVNLQVPLAQLPNLIQWMSDGTYLYVTINGTQAQVPLADSGNPLRFQPNGANQLFATINGSPSQIPLSDSAHPIRFQPNGTNQLFLTIDATQSQVVLCDPGNPIRFSSDGTHLYVNIGGVTYQVTLT